MGHLLFFTPGLFCKSLKFSKIDFTGSDPIFRPPDEQNSAAVPIATNQRQRAYNAPPEGLSERLCRALLPPVCANLFSFFPSRGLDNATVASSPAVAL